MAVGVEPIALTFNPAQNRIYVANYESNSISVIRDSALGVAERAPPFARRASLEAYPNPFSNCVRLQVVIDRLPSDVRVYDANGALVRSLDIPQSPARSPQYITWDAKDGQGRSLPPGIYFCALESGTEHLTRKLVLSR
jgi:DNA-binding beta-propeller fold protein YncE